MKMPPRGWLPHNKVLVLQEAILSASLARSRDALLAGLPEEFSSSLAVTYAPASQILSDLEQINRTQTLSDGTVPLQRWLENACVLAGVRNEKKLFEEALELFLRGEGPEATIDCPYLGLEIFEEERAKFFFGRDADAEAAVAMLGAHAEGDRRWLQIEGPSGVGKSSLARAGILPRVRAGGVHGAYTSWCAAVMRPGAGPLLNLAIAVCEVLALDKIGAPSEILKLFADSDDALATLLRARVPPRGGVLLVVDQLEELFTLADREAAEMRRFDALLSRALRDRDGPLYLVTTVRSDFLGRTGELPELGALLNVTLFPTGEQMTVTVDGAAVVVRVTGPACPPGSLHDEAPR